VLKTLVTFEMLANRLESALSQIPDTGLPACPPGFTLLTQRKPAFHWAARGWGGLGSPS